MQTLPDASVEEAQEAAVADPWVTIVWNDPVNLMSYVTYVFESYFGHPRQKAERLMKQVHEQGRAVVSTSIASSDPVDTTARPCSCTCFMSRSAFCRGCPKYDSNTYVT